MRLLMLLMVLFGSSVALADWHVDPASSAVTFVGIGNPGFLKVDGEGGKVAGGPLAFTVQLDDLKTGIALRDQHMKEKYLETGKFPEAKLVLPAPLAATGDFEAQLTLHGVTRPVKGHAVITPEGKRLAVVAEFHCQLPDFGIAEPGWRGVTVAKDITVRVSFMADP